MAAQVNDILQCKKCGRNTHRISCLSSNTLLNSFSFSYRSPPCHCDMLNSLSYLFVHSFPAQRVLLKGCAGQQGQKLLLCFVLDVAPSEGRKRWCFLPQQAESLCWKTFGKCRMEEAGSLQLACESVRKQWAQTQRWRTLSETVGESAATQGENRWMEDKVRRKDGHGG